MTTDVTYLNQRIATSKKNKEWRRSMMDYLCYTADDWYTDWVRMMENYALKNNQLNREEYRDICRGIGNETDGKIFVDAYNKTHNIIDALRGEEWNRPFSFDIVNNSKKMINRLERDKRREIDSLVSKVYEIEMKKQQELYKVEMSSVSEQEQKKKGEEIQARYAKLYRNLDDPKKILDKYENITTAEEVTMSRILKMMVSRLNIKFIKNQTFEDALLAGVETVELYTERPGELPKVKQLNPPHVFFQKSPDVQWIHEADYAGYKYKMTIGKAVEEFGDIMSDEDYIKLTSLGHHGGIRGLNAPLQTNRKAPSQWKEQIRNGSFQNGRDMMSEEFLILDEKYGGPNYGFMGTKQVDMFGLSAVPSRRNRSEYVDVYTAYWKSQRRIGRYEFVNEYGELDETFVDEDFVIPKTAKKEAFKETINGVSKSKYVWSDKEDKRYSLQWIWVPEVWKGVRIGSDIYVEIGPLQHAYQSLLNPYQVKLPIYGYIYNNRNAFTVSVMDRMKPWQKLYYVLMARLLKLITQDRGVLTFLNIQMIDKNLGLEKTLQLAEDQGIIAYNPLANAKGAGSNVAMLNTMKVAEKIDATNSNVIQHYITLLQFIEQNIKLAAGMSDQRIAQTDARMTATDNYRDTMHSVNMTEPLHAAHDLLWQEILQGMMEMTLSILGESTGKIRDFLDDDSKVIIDLDMVSLEDNFRLRIADNSKAFRVLEQVKGLSQALIQNDKASLATLVDLLETENLSEFKAMAVQVEKDYQDRTDGQAQQQREHEKEMVEMQRKAAEDMQINQLDNTYLKGYIDYLREEMKAKYNAASFDLEKDYNRDGVPDYMQLKQLEAKLAIDNRRLDIEGFKVGQKEREMELRVAEKNADLADKHVDRQVGQVESDKERQSKLMMEKIKSRIQGAKTK